MRVKELNQKVCEKLAKDLISVEADIVKQNTVLEGIKRMIAEKKTDVIRGMLEGEELKFPSRKYMVFSVELGSQTMDGDEFVVHGFFATDPKWVEDSDFKLTAAEKKLFAVYKDAYENYFDYRDKDEIIRMKEAAAKMRTLKNELKLVLFKFWPFSFEDAVKGDFFEGTGVRVYLDSFRRPFLEDLRV